MVDVTNKPQIVEHIHKSLTQTVYEAKWIPTSATAAAARPPPRQTGLIQIYRLGQGDIELEAELERPKAFKRGTFGHTSLAERQLATGDFDGSLAVWDLEKLQQPVFSVKGHDTIINLHRRLRRDARRRRARDRDGQPRRLRPRVGPAAARPAGGEHGARAGRADPRLLGGGVRRRARRTTGCSPPATTTATSSCSTSPRGRSVGRRTWRTACAASSSTGRTSR